MKISILMTCYNRGHLLDLSLPSVLRQNPTEIIIVDDGSTDDTKQIVESWQQRLAQTSIKYYYRDHPGYNNGAIPKNIALKNSTGDLIIVSDPEVVHVTDVIDKMVKHHQEREMVYTVASRMYFIPEVVQPRITELVLKPENLQKFLAPADCYHVGYIARENLYYMDHVEAPFIGGFKRQHLFAVGGWDEQFDAFWGHEDTDIITRLGLYGDHRIIDHTIVGLHQYHNRPTLEAMAGVDSYNLPIVQSRYKDLHYKVNLDKKWGVLS